MPVIDERQELAKKSDLATKQDILTPGTGITIQNNVISSTSGSTVTVSPADLPSPVTQIGSITVNGDIKTLFAPTPPTISVTQTQLSGDELATITVNGTPFTIYAPEGTVVLSGTSAPTAAQGENGDLYVQYTVTSGVYTVDMTYVKLSGAWVELSAGGGGGGNVDDVYVNGTSVLDSNKIAQIVSYKEVTQAEYDALPASKLTDNVLYCIKDKATADTTVAPIIYSEEEREIGVWTDGKPLYQKTINFTMSRSSSWQSYNHGIADIDKVVNVHSLFVVSNTTYPLPQYRDNSNAIIICAGTTAVEWVNTWVVDADVTCTLQYTKTTDQPGSGKYAPSGVPAVHYSTDEQVVGTWIDGSTVYEISTICDVSASSSTWSTADFNVNMDDINVITEVKGAFCRTQDKWTVGLNYYEASNSWSTHNIDKNTTTGKASLNYKSYAGAGKVYITIRYTKQTS